MFHCVATNESFAASNEAPTMSSRIYLKKMYEITYLYFFYNIVPAIKVVKRRRRPSGDLNTPSPELEIHFFLPDCDRHGCDYWGVCLCVALAVAVAQTTGQILTKDVVRFV